MRLSLKEALEQVDLEPGQTYHCEVKGQIVEVRVGISGHQDKVLVIREDHFMLEPWVELPLPPAVGTIIPRMGSLESFLPDPPIIPDEETGE